MSGEPRDLVQYRMERAAQSLQAAEVSLGQGLLNDAVNREYYACFYAVSALLVCRGLSASKHSGVRSLFEKHFIKDGPLPRQWGRFFHQIFDLRQEGDYADFTSFAKEDVAAWLDQAKAFVAEVDRFIAIRGS